MSCNQQLKKALASGPKRPDFRFLSGSEEMREWKMTAPARTMFKKKLNCLLKLQSGENERKNHCSPLNFFQSRKASENWSLNTLPLNWVEKASLRKYLTRAAIPSFGSLQPESQATATLSVC